MGIRSLALVVTASIALSACGSSSSSSAPSGGGTGPAAKTRPSGTPIAAFIASADAICKAGTAALQPLKLLNNSTSNTAAQQILQNASGAFTVVTSELAALHTPPSLAEAWNTYVSDAKQEETDVSGMADAIGAGDTATLERDLNQSRQLSRQAERALAGKGFSHCGAHK